MKFADLRQLRYPKTFRIPRPQWNPELRLAGPSQQEQLTQDASEGLDFKQQCKFVAEIATELWRLKQKMSDERTAEAKEEMRRPYRHVVSALDILSDAGVEIQGHTGQPYRSGLAVEALAFQPTAEIARETMIETVRPSIYFNQKQIQQGQVIVGTPLKKE